MGVFQNTYVPNYQKMVEELEKEKLIEDQNFFIIYMTTVINTFKWGNLPDKMPKFNMETYLQTAGLVGYFVEGDRKMMLPAFPQGGLTEYGEFSKYVMLDALGKTYIRDKDEIELCYNSSLKIPYIAIVKGFANNASKVLRYTYAALRRASKPPIIGCENESQLKMLDSLRDSITDNKDFVAFCGEGVMDSSVKRLPLFDNRETDVLAMWDIYTRQRNLFYSTFGINNVEIQKRERLTEAEGSGNDEIVRYSLLDDMVDNRKDFIERVKNHFGDVLTLDVNRDASTVWALNQTNDELIKMYNIAMTKGANIGADVSVNTENKEGDVNESDV